MPRPKGSRVIVCKTEKCGGRIVGMPGERKRCQYCNRMHTIPKGKKG